MNKKNKSTYKSSSGQLASGGVLAGFLSLVGASCCVLPVLLVNLGVGTALVSRLGVLARLQPWFLGLTIILIGAGLISAFRGTRPSRRTLALLVGATILAIGAFALPFQEGHILSWLGSAG